MKAVKLQLANRTLLNPAAQQWGKVPVEELSLGGTPLHHQSSRYVRTAWAGKTSGAVRSLKVQAAHNGKNIAIRLEWPDETQNADHGDGSVFPDAAGILFPLNGDAQLESMGSPEAPVTAWYWRSNFPDGQAQNLIAKGVGTVEASRSGLTEARARWADGRWQVVFTRALSVRGDRVRFSPRRPTKVAFAVWEGSSQERAGLKSFSRAWQELEIQ
jgi:DMSO reductase family type II enzyme heme b subunit